jgi:hypothetical protein
MLSLNIRHAEGTVLFTFVRPNILPLDGFNTRGLDDLSAFLVDLRGISCS